MLYCFHVSRPHKVVPGVDENTLKFIKGSEWFVLWSYQTHFGFDQLGLEMHSFRVEGHL